eukprot:CAMPEP_0177598696 /NCGR_PEP_ID=MMETSP0419_2-20121207/12521_1 /TAXON_ID=582737 /ORGANISM="Tetraselmis sp., Strain GSL018" /LENGTH=480 /DNA_ID=CAMNT_0019091227 /DNA_START=259 /DNA_END=1701 /DNA_ORIENTATION=-
MADEYDLITIGAGSGGTRASRWAAQQYGVKVAVVELPFDFISSDSAGGAGGTCVIRGCVPKKLLVYASAFSSDFKDAEGFGWGSQLPPLDFKTLISKKADEVKRLNGIYNNLLKNAGVDQIEGRGKLLDANTVEVTQPDGSKRILKAKHILVAVGGRAVKLDIPGAEHGITSDEALHLDNFPQKDIVILGGGYIAVEFAGIFSGLGAKVHLVYRQPTPLRGFDEECRQQVAENLEKRGVICHPKCNPARIEKKPDGSLLFTMKDGEGNEKTVESEFVMFATGRKPNVANLGLEELGVTMLRNGAIKVDDYSRTSVPNVWAIGDVTDRINLTPVALMEGMAFAKSAFGGELTKPDHANVPSAVFCQPPLGTCGLSEEEAIEQLEGDIDVYVSKFKPMKNTLTGKDEKVLMKIIVHVPTDKVVGVHMVGVDSAEILQAVGICMKMGATKKDFDSCVGIHPSTAEELVTMRTATRRVQGKGKK